MHSLYEITRIGPSPDTAVLDGLEAAALLLDETGRIGWVNRCGADLLGARAETLIAQQWMRRFVAPSQRRALQERFAAALTQDAGVVWCDAATLCAPDGRRREVLWWGLPWRSPSVGPGMLLVLCEVPGRSARAMCCVPELGPCAQWVADWVLREARQRRRCSQVLHREVAQELCALGIQLDRWCRDVDPTHREGHWAAVRRTLQAAVRATRQVALETSCPALYELGLTAAVRMGLLEPLQRQACVRAHLSADGPYDRLSERDRTLLFDGLRQWLTARRQQGGLSDVRLTLQRSGESLVVRVWDDGSATDLESTELGAGWFALRCCMTVLGGTVQIRREPTGGNELILEVPLRENVDDA